MSSSETPDIAAPTQDKAKFLAKTRKTLYYGLAIDSIVRPLHRTKRISGDVIKGMGVMTRSIFRSPTFKKAKTIEEIVNVHDNCASTMIGTVIVIIFYAYFTIKTSSNTYALIANGVISIAFTFYFFCHLFVYLRCQQILIELKKSGNLNNGDNSK